MATTALIVGALASAGSAAYSAKQQSDAAKAMGGKPDAAEYRMIDFGDEQRRTILDNITALPAIDILNQGANAQLTRQDLRRIGKFIPNFRSIMRTQAENANNLVNGRLPFEDVMDIVANRGSLDASLGTPGASGPATLRDLGISRLSAINSGQSLLQSMVSTAEQVSPIARYTRPSDFLLSPQQTIPWAIQQAQLEQQSSQSANNLAAGASPAELAQNALAASGGGNPFSGVGPALSSIAPLLQSGSGFSPTTTGGYQSAAAASAAAPYAGGFTFDPNVGYVPTGTTNRYSIPAL